MRWERSLLAAAAVQAGRLRSPYVCIQVPACARVHAGVFQCMAASPARAAAGRAIYIYIHYTAATGARGAARRADSAPSDGRRRRRRRRAGGPRAPRAAPPGGPGSNVTPAPIQLADRIRYGAAGYRAYNISLMLNQVIVHRPCTLTVTLQGPGIGVQLPSDGTVCVPPIRSASQLVLHY